MSRIAVLIAFRYSSLGSPTELVDLQNCLKSVLSSVDDLYNSPINKCYVDVYIIDDHSNEQYINSISISLLERVKIINNRNLLGQGNALNYALNTVNADYYAFTDSDCIVESTWLYKIISYFNLHPSRSCVVGPNWFHQKSCNRWQRYITYNESKLMKYIFESYIDFDKKSSLRIDCRNLAIKMSFLNNYLTKNIFSEVYYANSSQTSYNWRNSELDMGSIVGYNNQLIVYHNYIPSLRNHIKKYFLRGKHGDFSNIYAKKYDYLISAFIRYYFKRHFLSPHIKTKVSILYLWLVHGAFWLGISVKKVQNSRI
jgi:hypothetical protein